MPEGSNSSAAAVESAAAARKGYLSLPATTPLRDCGASLRLIRAGFLVRATAPGDLLALLFFVVGFFALALGAVRRVES
ncbi:MAG TPA: hypothetical protein VN317_10290 [Candidatus Methanoperedens sp.]|nr:hypothetical protein [Candidatus Methanoperedens sp.]